MSTDATADDVPPILAQVANHLPLVLLPVRLETRYLRVPTEDENGEVVDESLWPWQLTIRIYPDDIHVDSHEPGLTADERQWGEQFRAHGGGTATAQGRTAWEQLAQRFGPRRATYIADALRPGAPASPARESTWTKRATAMALPERWMAIGYRGGQPVAQSYSWTVTDNLPVGPGPGDERTGADDTVFDVPPALRWLVDPVAAWGRGMVIDLPLGSTPQLDRLVVFGLRGREGAAGSTTLADLLTRHRYTDGLALVGPGTPTNNAPETPSGFDSNDPGHRRSGELLWGPRLAQPSDGSDASRLAGALGFPVDRLDRVSGAGARHAHQEQAMNAALWPATWGAFLRRHAGMTATALEPYRRHFVDWVRGGGPLPALRVGRQPYGVLPVVSLRRWQPASSSAEEVVLVDLVNRLAPLWAAVAGANGPGQRSLSALLRRTPVSDGYAARGVFATADWLTPAVVGFMGLDRPTVDQRVNRAGQQVQQVRNALGRGPLFADLAASLALPQAWPGICDTVQPADLAPAGAGAGAAVWLQALAAATPAQLSGDVAAPPYASLLYRLLLHASRLAAASANGTRPSTVPPFTPRGFLDRLDPAGPAEYAELLSALAFLHDLADDGAGVGAGVDRLRLLAHTALDLAGHRLDAWVTSLASRRLATLRNRGVTGAVLGAYGWVEGLAPRTGLDVVPPPPGEGPPWTDPLYHDSTNAGFVHAPSLQHAATTAVLRSGHLSHLDDPTAPGDGASPFAINLSSARARLATWLLDGIRQGLPLPILLGYRFERALVAAGLSTYLDDFRRLAPSAPGASPDGDVVDGLELLRLHRENAIPWGTAGLPGAAVVEAPLRHLLDGLDAISDAVVAEAVHQTIQGHFTRAASALAVLSTNESAPPELDVLRTPRSGTAVTHRLVTFLGHPASPGPWVEGPREQAEPGVGRWAAAVLGSPGRVVADVEVRDRENGALLGAPIRVRLTELTPKPTPLELLAAGEGAGDLARRVALHVLDPARRGDLPAAADVALRPVPATHVAAGDLYIEDLLEVARAANRVLAAARPLDAHDLVPPGVVVDPGLDVDDLAARLVRVRPALVAATNGLRDAVAAPPPDPAAGPPDPARPAALRAALVAAARLAVPGAWPAVGDDGSAGHVAVLHRQASAVHEEVARRLEAVTAFDATPTAAARIAQLRLVLGGSVPVVPRWTPVDQAAVDRAFGQVTVVDPLHPGHDPLTWLARMARVRQPVAHVEELGDLAEALGLGARLTPAVGQLPAAAAGAPAQRWIGLPRTAPDAELPPNVVALVATGGAPPPAPGGGGGGGGGVRTLAGLVLDEWNEVVPAGRETTAVTFHYDAPGAAAPQSVLVVLPPKIALPGETGHGLWQEADIAGTLVETMDLARLRTVDATDLGGDLGGDHPLFPIVALPDGDPSSPARVPVERLVARPPGYALVQQAQAPALGPVTIPELQQGVTVDVTVNGQRLTGATWTVSGAGVTVTVRPPVAGDNVDTTVRLRLAVGADAAVGSRALIAAHTGGQASAPCTVTYRPRVDALSLSLVRQEQRTEAVYTIDVSGQRFDQFPGVRAVGTNQVSITFDPAVPKTATQFRVRVVVIDSPRPEVVWDPTEPGGDRKPPRIVSYREMVPFGIELFTTGNPPIRLDSRSTGCPLTLDALLWREEAR